MDRGSLPRKASAGSIAMIGNLARYKAEKTLITCFTALALMMISPAWALPSKPMYGMRIARSCRGGTGQPGCQLKGTSAGVSGPDTTTENAGAGGLAEDGAGLGVAWREEPASGWADGAL